MTSGAAYVCRSGARVSVHPATMGDQTMSGQPSTREAYEAMFCFLEAHFDRDGSDELAALLGSLALNADGQPMDPAAWTDWLAAVRIVTGDDPSP